MRHLFRSALLGLTLLGTLSFVGGSPAEARTNFSLSIGVPLGGYYGGHGYGHGHYGYYDSYWPGYYDRPYYRPYAPRPRYYSPAYYPRPVYRPYRGPIMSLGLFPAYVGDALSYDDRDVYFTAYRRALAAPIGQSIAWNSNGISGGVTTTRDGWSGQRYCREFRQDVSIGGQRQEAYGTACQTPDGDWQLVDNQ